MWCPLLCKENSVKGRQRGRRPTLRDRNLKWAYTQKWKNDEGRTRQQSERLHRAQVHILLTCIALHLVPFESVYFPIRFYINVCVYTVSSTPLLFALPRFLLLLPLIDLLRIANLSPLYPALILYILVDLCMHHMHYM